MQTDHFCFRLMSNPSELVVMDKLTTVIFDMLYNNFSSDEAILAAIRNENACNSVLRTASQIVLQIATQQNATRLELIRTGTYRLKSTKISCIEQVTTLPNVSMVYKQSYYMHSRYM